MQPEQQQLSTMTGPCLKTGILEIYANTRNKFNALQEISKTPTANDEYENFVNANLEVVAECIPTKQRAKPRVPWETLAVRKSVQT